MESYLKLRPQMQVMFELSRKLAQGLITEGVDVTYIEFSKANHISIPTQEEYPANIQAFISKLSVD